MFNTNKKKQTQTMRAYDVVIQIKEAKFQIKNENYEMANRKWSSNEGLITVIATLISGGTRLEFWHGKLPPPLLAALLITIKVPASIGSFTSINSSV